MNKYSLENWVNKFGRCADVDAGETVDVYDNGGAVNAYPWPAAVAETTIVSDDAADTSAGTGARVVEVQGLDSDYAFVSERATMNGATPVTLDTQFLRVFRVKVITAGSGATNAGVVSVKHGATVLASISLGFGQTLMAIYTMPDGFEGRLANWHGNINIVNDGTLSFRLDVRSFGGAWQCKETFDLGGRAGAEFSRSFQGWQSISAKSDIRIRVFGGSDNNTIVSAGFDLFTRRA